MAIAAHSLVHMSLLELAGAPTKESMHLHPVLASDYDDYLDDLVESRVETIQRPCFENSIMSLD